MRKCFLIYFFSLGLVQLTCAASTSVVDSVGTVIKNGKTFIIHKVEPKQTLYGLARQYGVPVTAVQQANPGLTSLAVGQTIFVPGREGASATNTASVTRPAAANPVTTAPETNQPATTSTSVAGSSTSGTREHQVEARQTLYAIARQYNVSPADLKKWNNLTSDNLQEGQTLLVAPPVANAATASSTIITTPVEEETSEAAPAATTRPAVKSATSAATTRESAPVKVERTETRVSENLSRISESGLAEVMDKSEGSKYLALHKTAPVGTILQVKNTLNNQSVYVRVSGKMPEGNNNDRVIIKLSKRAYQKLAATASRFQVEVNYMP